MKPKIMIGLPSYDGTMHVQAAIAALMQASKHQIAIAFSTDSMLTRCFNRLWVAALKSREQGFTHFAMLHADVIPESFWVDKLVSIMADKKCQLLSAISPIKNQEGLTSCGIAQDRWTTARFTMRQLEKMPITFTHSHLVVNTGCLLVDLTWGDWEGLYFRTMDLVEGDKVLSATEDYLFSSDCRARGGKVFATRAVKLEHVGATHYPNYGGWGTMEVDRIPARLED